MREFHVIARRVETISAKEPLYAYDCPPCGREADTSRMLPEEILPAGRRSVFCGRWGCDALLHVQVPGWPKPAEPGPFNPFTPFTPK